MDRFKQYIENQWWNGIEKRDLENWVRNFGTSEEIAKLILDNVIFYNEQQLKAYTKFLVGKLKNEVYMNTIKNNGFKNVNDDIIFNNWENYLIGTKIVPAANRNDPTSSAYKIVRYWRSVLGQEKIGAITDGIENSYKLGIKRFIFVDDFSGSGTQMSKFLEEKIIFNNEEIKLGDLPCVCNDIDIIVAVYVIHEKAIEFLQKQFPNIKFLYVDLINENFNYMNNSSFMYEKMNLNEKNDIIDQIKKLTENIKHNNAELLELSAYLLNIPIVFEHGCPNNTLLLLFAHTDDWQQLFKRGIEI
jgi:hypothetical protein